MCIGVVFSGLWAALSVVNIALKKPMDAVIISITGIVVCIISLIVLIPSYGAAGAAWGMNGAYMAGTFSGLFLLFKSKRNKAEMLNH
jgi:Na+-driven multidrug efflux pump